MGAPGRLRAKNEEVCLTLRETFPEQSYLWQCSTPCETKTSQSTWTLSSAPMLGVTRSAARTVVVQGGERWEGTSAPLGDRCKRLHHQDPPPPRVS